MKKILDLLPASEYIQEACEKDLIVIHHTVSDNSPLQWFKTDPRQIATCYAIENENVYQFFVSEKHWAWHVGAKFLNVWTAKRTEQRSIGIELISWGALEKRGNKFITGAGYPWNGPVYEVPQGFRGYNYFAPYNLQSVDTLCELVNDILARNPKIPRDIPVNPFEYSRHAESYTGIVFHCTLRKDKSDLHPGFPLQRLIEKCNLRAVD